jgi:hypothetical protein
VRSVDRFYRVRFADEKVLREWTMRVLEVAAARQDVATRAEPRLVVFVPFMASRRGSPYAYVSESARGLAHGLARGVDLDESTQSLPELPDGLSLLIGDSSDAEAYEHRLRGPSGRGG